ncbi:hypothetical protein PGB90_007755 [Kerria lacca]
MAQGKFKFKNKAPINTKKIKKVTQPRKNCPAAPKKWKYIEGQKIKRIIMKNVNQKAEEEIRALVNNTTKVNLSNKKNNKIVNK